MVRKVGESNPTHEQSSMAGKGEHDESLQLFIKSENSESRRKGKKHRDVVELPSDDEDDQENLETKPMIDNRSDTGIKLLNVFSYATGETLGTGTNVGSANIHSPEDAVTDNCLACGETSQKEAVCTSSLPVIEGSCLQKSLKVDVDQNGKEHDSWCQITSHNKTLIRCSEVSSQSRLSFNDEEEEKANLSVYTSVSWLKQYEQDSSESSDVQSTSSTILNIQPVEANGNLSSFQRDLAPITCKSSQLEEGRKLNLIKNHMDTDPGVMHKQSSASKQEAVHCVPVLPAKIIPAQTTGALDVMLRPLNKNVMSLKVRNGKFTDFTVLLPNELPRSVPEGSLQYIIRRAEFLGWLVHICSCCGKAVVSMHALNAHTRFHSRVLRNRPDFVNHLSCHTYFCNICSNFETTNPLLILDHELTHSSVTYQRSRSIEQAFTVLSPSSSYMFICEMCEEKFVIYSDLIQHLKGHFTYLESSAGVDAVIKTVYGKAHQDKALLVYYPASVAPISGPMHKDLQQANAHIINQPHLNVQNFGKRKRVESKVVVPVKQKPIPLDLSLGLQPIHSKRLDKPVMFTKDPKEELKKENASSLCQQVITRTDHANSQQHYRISGGSFDTLQVIGHNSTPASSTSNKENNLSQEKTKIRLSRNSKGVITGFTYIDPNDQESDIQQTGTYTEVAADVQPFVGNQRNGRCTKEAEQNALPSLTIELESVPDVERGPAVELDNDILATVKSDENSEIPQLPSGLPKLFKCWICNEAFERYFILQRHMKLHVTNEPARARSNQTVEEQIKQPTNVGNKEIDNPKESPPAYPVALFANTLMPNAHETCRLEKKDEKESLQLFHARANFSMALSTVSNQSTENTECPSSLGVKDTAPPGQHGYSAMIKKSELIHKCQICNRVFADYKEMLTHVITHEKVYVNCKCYRCGAHVKNYETFELHIRGHEKAHYQGTCYRCGLEFLERVHWIAHLKKRKCGPGYRCVGCELLCNSSFTLKQHRSTHLRENKGSVRMLQNKKLFKRWVIRQIGSDIIAEPDEDVEFKGVDQHLDKFVNKEVEEEISDEKSSEQTGKHSHVGKESVSTCKCCCCSDSFSNSIEMDSHIQERHNFVCSICRQRLLTAKAWSFHEKKCAKIHKTLHYKYRRRLSLLDDLNLNSSSKITAGGSGIKSSKHPRESLTQIGLSSSTHNRLEDKLQSKGRQTGQRGIREYSNISFNRYDRLGPIIPDLLKSKLLQVVLERNPILAEGTANETYIVRKEQPSALSSCGSGSVYTICSLAPNENVVNNKQ